jgi:hypothetical protein
MQNIQQNRQQAMQHQQAQVVHRLWEMPNTLDSQTYVETLFWLAVIYLFPHTRTSS